MSSSDMLATGMFVPAQSAGTVLCCSCGVTMPPNPANRCKCCLRSEVDITEGLTRHATIVYCPECRSYLQPPRTWIRGLEPESKDLLDFCLRRVRLRRVRCVQAKFIWTEPHSKRLRLLLCVEAEVLGGATLRQAHMVELTVHDHLCDNCSMAQANPDQWSAVVQIRQHVPHRRTFFYLEQLVLRYAAAVRAVRIAEADHGLDFFFGSRSHATKFVAFINSVSPIRFRNDNQLVSHNPKRNIYNYKHTFSVEICPVCREDLICLPAELAHELGNLGPLVLCTKVTDSIALLDPVTLHSAFLDPHRYWRAPFRALLTSRQLVEYIVLYVGASVEASDRGTTYRLADAHVVRVADFGKNNTTFTVSTHLGHLFNSGDHALGYDLANSIDSEIDQHRDRIPDAILVKKLYQKRHGKQRSWKLKRLNKEVDTTSKGRADEEKRNTEYEEFLRDVEENPEMRFNISLYQNKEYQPSENASTADGGDVPSVPLEELLADLDLTEVEEENQDGDTMEE